MKRSRRKKNVPLICAMASKGLTGQALARQSGLHPITISAILNNRVEPKAKTQRAIASVLKTSPRELFQSEEER